MIEHCWFRSFAWIAGVWFVFAGLHPALGATSTVVDSPASADVTTALPAGEQSSSAVPAGTVGDRLPWQVVAQGDGVFKVLAGSRFEVVVNQPLASDTASAGDPVYARLVEDMKLDGVVAAAAGSLVSGHVTSVDKARRQLRSDVPGRHWLDANGAIAVVFDELLAESGRSLDINAVPAAGTRLQRANSEAAPLVVDKKGDITFAYRTKTYGVLSLAIEGASIASGPIGLAAGPMLSGIAGAMSPSYAFSRPSQDVSGHRRVKGFFMGMVKGAPGGFLITGVANHGDNVALAPDDRITLELTCDLSVDTRSRPAAKAAQSE